MTVPFKKALVSEPLLNKVAGLKVCNIIKKQSPSRLFSLEYYEIFKNSLLYETPSVAASENGRGISKEF